MLDFWHQRWQANQIGFHLDQVNPLLQKFWSSARDDQKESVLVPLCGKTHDLLWLAQQQESVQGIEVSEIAVNAFFSENALTPVIHNIDNRIALYQCNNISILLGDYFTVPIAPVDLVYDRAACIALPKNIRARYVKRLQSLIKPNGRLLLIVLNLDEDLPNINPPFSVTLQEIQQLYADKTITLLHQEDYQGDQQQFKNAVQQVYLVEGF